MARLPALQPPSLEELRAAADAVVIYQRVYGDGFTDPRGGTLPPDEAEIRQGGWVPHERTIVPKQAVRGEPNDWCMVLARADNEHGMDVLHRGTDNGGLYDMAMYVHRTGQISHVDQPDCTIFLQPR